jgi:hypothetical protein
MVSLTSDAAHGIHAAYTRHMCSPAPYDRLCQGMLTLRLIEFIRQEVSRQLLCLASKDGAPVAVVGSNAYSSFVVPFFRAYNSESFQFVRNNNIQKRP